MRTAGVSIFAILHTRFLSIKRDKNGTSRSACETREVRKVILLQFSFVPWPFKKIGMQLKVWPNFHSVKGEDWTNNPFFKEALGKISSS
jgi:hypothetical protein